MRRWGDKNSPPKRSSAVGSGGGLVLEGSQLAVALGSHAGRFDFAQNPDQKTSGELDLSQTGGTRPCSPDGNLPQLLLNRGTTMGTIYVHQWTHGGTPLW